MSRRFLPADPRAVEPYRFTPQLALRVGVLAALALIIFAILFLRLWALQVLSGDQYLNAAQNNQLRSIAVEAPRGSIVDRAGRTIVSNVPGTAVKIWTADLPKEGRYAMLQRLSKILRVPLPRLTKALEERKGDPLTPILVKTAVHEDQVMYLQEHRDEFPGVEIAGTYLRDYEHKALAAQLLGYVGEISKEELEQLEPEGYRGGEKIGKTGVESAFDGYLRGTPGIAQLRVDSLGRPQSGFAERRPAQPGYSVRLTLDIGLQRAAERALREGIETAYEHESFNANGGAIIALDPRDGAVLALASNPTYKPSVYVGRVDPKKLEPLTVEKVAKERNYPGINRATAGVYPPGSTFKPLTALAAISDGLLSPYEYIQCTPSAKYGLDDFEFKNWNPFTNAPMTLTTALAQSCDTYFYDVGNRYFERGEREQKYWTAMQKWAAKFGFGTPTGLDIGGEVSGLLPTPAWRQATYKGIDRAWNPGDLIQLAIGQKDLTVTPLQMARFYAALANGGKLVTPYLVTSVERPGGEGQPPVPVSTFAPPPPTSIDVDPTALSVVREGLYQATHDSEGTSSGVFGSFPVPVAGKTGTAEKVVNLPGYPLGHLEDQAWWCGWGPFDGNVHVTTGGSERPPLVVCAVIENGGHGGTAAAPAALKVFEHWFREQAGVQAEVFSD
ncbi:MAG: penicillin-binding protein 2 [Actinomycetota bacterium]|nr:penicillin-binding protein 2 [Actinomycetota bacterium]